MCANSEDSGETAWVRRLAWAFVDRLIDMIPLSPELAHFCMRECLMGCMAISLELKHPCIAKKIKNLKNGSPKLCYRQQCVRDFLAQYFNYIITNPISWFIKPHWSHRINTLFILKHSRIEAKETKIQIIWAATWQNQQSDCVPSEDSDQPRHPLSLISVFDVRMKKTWVFSNRLSAQRKLWSDWADAQADLSLLWAHNHFVGFVMSRLICSLVANRY